MSEVRRTYDDETDLFDLVETLWDSKWLISAFVSIALLCGSGYLLVKESVYGSKLIYSIDTLPPFYEEEKVLSDFRKIFYSNRVFDDWKTGNSNISITFDDFSATKVVNGFVISKDKDERIINLVTDKQGASFILVKTNELLLLEGFFNYANHVNEALKSNYILRAKDELNIIETRFKDFSSANEAIISKILATDRFIAAVEKGAQLLTIQRPTMPEKIAPKSFFILVMSVVLGGIMAVLFILVRNAFRKRKERLA